jgi:hypothetical protein
MKNLKLLLGNVLLFLILYFSISSCRDIDEFIQSESNNILITERDKILNSFGELKNIQSFI